MCIELNPVSRQVKTWGQRGSERGSSRYVTSIHRLLTNHQLVVLVTREHYLQCIRIG